MATPLPKSGNKVTFGLSNVHYAIYKGLAGTGKHEWEKPIHIPGAVSFSPAPDSSQSDFYADNIKYYSATTSSGGINGDLVMALFPKTFLRDILGWKIGMSGLLVPIAGAIAVPFALLFEVMGNMEPLRTVFYNCTGAEPVDSFTTDTNNRTVATQSMPISAVPIMLEGFGPVPKLPAVTRSENEAAFVNFFNEVFVEEYDNTGIFEPYSAAGGSMGMAPMMPMAAAAPMATETDSGLAAAAAPLAIEDKGKK